MYFTDAVSVFDLKLREAQKARERVAIQAVLNTKKQRITAVKTRSDAQLKEAAEAMHNKTQTVLPKNLENGLRGKVALSADSYFKSIPRPNFTTPVKRG